MVKKTHDTSLGKNVDNGNPQRLLVGMKLYNHLKTLYYLTKLHMHLSHDPAFLILGIYPRERKVYAHIKTYV